MVRVGIVGDSAMWGQGLARQHTYAHLAATALAQELGEPLQLLTGRNTIDPQRGEARSGAKIRPGPVAQDDADDFLEMFPRLFTSDTERLDFRFARNEAPAARLFGEHPATFPTVIDGLRALATQNAQTVDVLFLDGGINDLDFEEVLDPEGAGLRTIERKIREIFGDSLKSCLLDARRQFPGAVIVVVGYFSALSKESSRAELERLFKYLAEKPEWQVWLNDRVQDVPLVRDILNTFLTKDVQGLIEKAISRSLVAAAYAHFWTRRTILTLPRAIAGPGVVYAHPGFTPRHALFAGRSSLLYDGYRQPGDTRRGVNDEMLQQRVANIPRVALLDDYKRIQGQILPWTIPTSGRLPTPAAVEALLRDLRDLLRERDLPTPLRTAARALVNDPKPANLGPLLESLANEIGRIEVTTIASFLHPNPTGAARIADRIGNALREHRGFSVRDAIWPLRGRGRTSVWIRPAMRAHALDPSRGLRSLIGVATVESVALRLEGLAAGLHPLTLSLGGIDFDFFATRSSSKQFFVAFDAQAGLGAVTKISLKPRRIGTIGGQVPQFTTGTIFINAREFLTSNAPRVPRAGRELVLWTPQR